jgi:flagellar basal-body rod modification protein FlgD
MSESITGVGSSIATQSSAQISGAMGQVDFMTLLIAQLQNQDPLNPLESYEFAAQLANFSTVDELAQVNQGLAAQLENSQMLTVLSKTTFGAALIGRSVLAEGNQVTVGSEGAGEIEVDVAADGAAGSLRILDDSGAVVATRDLGPIAAGRQTIALPEDLAAGTYSYELEVTNGEGQAVSVTTYTRGIVDRISFEDGSIQMWLSGIEIPLDLLVEISPAAATQA